MRIVNYRVQGRNALKNAEKALAAKDESKAAKYVQFAKNCFRIAKLENELGEKTVAVRPSLKTPASSVSSVFVPAAKDNDNHYPLKSPAQLEFVMSRMFA